MSSTTPAVVSSTGSAIAVNWRGLLQHRGVEALAESEREGRGLVALALIALAPLQPRRAAPSRGTLLAQCRLLVL
jgi:hypothetical protein